VPAPAWIVIRARRPREAAKDGAQDELIDGADGKVSKAKPVDPAFWNRLAVDANSMMAFIEGKSRLLDHSAGNDDLAHLGADIRNRFRAMHNPAQHIRLVQVIALGGNII